MASTTHLFRARSWACRWQGPRHRPHSHTYNIGNQTRRDARAPLLVSARTLSSCTAAAAAAATAGMDMRIEVLHAGYRNKQLKPSDVLKESFARLKKNATKHAFIMHLPSEQYLGRAAEQDKLLQETGHDKQRLDQLFQRYPLFGVPFSVKDNIDVAGYPTTAGCPDFACSPWESATLVIKAEDAGAVLVGKNNMDQFAAGLVGVRSPYGVAVNPHNADYVPGGSSSGSAVAVSTGQVSFAFGTDTAGSGRVPASFNNIVGLKPTKGLISAAGVVPACRSLDCMSVFATTCDDAWTVFSAVRGHDSKDVYSRSPSSSSDVDQLRSWRRRRGRSGAAGNGLRFGRPAGSGLAFFGDVSGADRLYHEACEALTQSVVPGSELSDVDFSPFREVAKQLYEGPWTAERLSAIESFFERAPEALHPVTRGIMELGARFTAADAFRAFANMSGLRQQAERAWQEADIDVMVVPTASITPTVQAVQDSPVSINTVLGYYTNFCNLLDLSVLSVPNGFLDNGMPSGISLIAPAMHDELLYRIGRAFHSSRDLPLGALQHRLSTTDATRTFDVAAFDRAQAAVTAVDEPQVEVAVCGAHMSGMALNSQLTELSAELVSQTRTAPHYKLFDITDLQSDAGRPVRPGLVRQAEDGGAVEVEVWRMSEAAFGRFVATRVTSPLAMGSVVLHDGRTVQGFVCEPFVLKDPSVVDITSHGGWRAYRTTNTQKPK